MDATTQRLGALLTSMARPAPGVSQEAQRAALEQLESDPGYPAALLTLADQAPDAMVKRLSLMRVKTEMDRPRFETRFGRLPPESLALLLALLTRNLLQTEAPAVAKEAAYCLSHAIAASGTTTWLAPLLPTLQAALTDPRTRDIAALVVSSAAELRPEQLAPWVPLLLAHAVPIPPPPGTLNLVASLLQAGWALESPREAAAATSAFARSQGFADFLAAAAAAATSGTVPPHIAELFRVFTALSLENPAASGVPAEGGHILSRFVALAVDSAAAILRTGAAAARMDAATEAGVREALLFVAEMAEERRCAEAAAQLPAVVAAMLPLARMPREDCEAAVADDEADAAKGDDAAIVSQPFPPSVRGFAEVDQYRLGTGYASGDGAAAAAEAEGGDDDVGSGGIRGLVLGLYDTLARQYPVCLFGDGTTPSPVYAALRGVLATDSPATMWQQVETAAKVVGSLSSGAVYGGVDFRLREVRPVATLLVAVAAQLPNTVGSAAGGPATLLAAAVVGALGQMATSFVPPRVDARDSAALDAVVAAALRFAQSPALMVQEAVGGALAEVVAACGTEGNPDAIRMLEAAHPRIVAALCAALRAPHPAGGGRFLVAGRGAQAMVDVLGLPLPFAPSEEATAAVIQTLSPRIMALPISAPILRPLLGALSCAVLWRRAVTTYGVPAALAPPDRVEPALRAAFGQLQAAAAAPQRDDDHVCECGAAALDVISAAAVTCGADAVAPYFQGQFGGVVQWALSSSSPRLRGAGALLAGEMARCGRVGDVPAELVPAIAGLMADTTPAAAAAAGNAAWALGVVGMAAGGEVAPATLAAARSALPYLAEAAGEQTGLRPLVVMAASVAVARIISACDDRALTESAVPTLAARLNAAARRVALHPPLDGSEALAEKTALARALCLMAMHAAGAMLEAGRIGYFFDALASFGPALPPELAEAGRLVHRTFSSGVPAYAGVVAQMAPSTQQFIRHQCA